MTPTWLQRVALALVTVMLGLAPAEIVMMRTALWGLGACVPTARALGLHAHAPSREADDDEDDYEVDEDSSWKVGTSVREHSHVHH